MLTRFNQSSRSRSWLLKRTGMFAALIFILSCDVVMVQAQSNFSSGSTGADGAFAPTANQEVQIPESGVFNFTTVDIPPGIRITFRRNSRNTPVTILASGNVTIRGTIDVSGGSNSRSVFDSGRGSGRGIGGPGGFDGGAGGASFSPFFLTNTAGDGPGGGSSSSSGGGGGFAQPGLNSCSGERGGPKYGSRTLVPLIGGSGGGGQRGFEGDAGFGGAGGGGAILIASSTTITFGPNQNSRGSILARGGNIIGGSAVGGGSGGAIRVVANTITGHAQLDVSSGSGSHCASGGHGYLRLEAFSFTGFQPNPLPSTTFDGQPMISLAQPNPVVLPNAPRLRIVSVAGIAAPVAPVGLFFSPPDLVVPTSLANPVEVAIEASNIPIGTVVQVMLSPDVGTLQTVQSAPLAGTATASTATASVNLPASGMSIITATVTFTPTSTSASAHPMMIDGERVDRVEVAASFGGISRTVYITQSGRRIAAAE